jgi:DNA polymerase III epsilon subunit-like protein
MQIKDQIVENFLKQVIAIDTESTGIDPKEAEICEIGVAASPNGKICGSSSALFGTKELIPFAASSKNNISRPMLKDIPSIEQNLETVVDLLALGEPNIKYIVAHNYDYDLTILKSTFNKLGENGLADEIENRKWICTYRLAQHLFKPSADNKDFSYALNFLRYAFELPCDKLTVHRAGDDAEVCWHLLRNISYYVLDNIVLKDELTENFNLGEFLYNMTKAPIEFTVMPFGKHKGVPLKEVPKDYYNWLLKNSDMLNEQSPGYDPDFAASVEKELNRRLGN